MRLPFFWVDAFTDSQFSGSPAAVCIVEAWPDDELMQSVATQNNLSETAFIRPRGDGWSIRWFTPAVEVDLCGHATLASASVIRRHFDQDARGVAFASRGGPLRAVFEGDLVVLDFPARRPRPTDTDGALASFEALFEVFGVDRLNFDANLVHTQSLDAERIWRAPVETGLN